MIEPAAAELKKCLVEGASCLTQYMTVKVDMVVMPTSWNGDDTDDLSV
jgi:hypothetical protein